MKFKGTSDSKNIVFLVVFGILCFLISASVLPFAAEVGTMPCPDLLLCLCCVIPKFYEKKASCVFAVVLGFFSDLFINTPLLFSPVVYLLCAAFVPYFYGYFKKVGTVVSAVCALPLLILRQIVGTVIIMSVRKTAVLGTVVGKVIFPELMAEFAIVLVLSFVIKLVGGYFGVRKNG